MKVSVQPGRYVVAVSGGVDSMTLLDILRRRPGVELVAAHFDHGIRVDSQSERELVQQVAKKYGLQFEYAEGNLGPRASEAVARQARYNFLERIRQKYQAVAIITAHHQDDLLETVVLNLLRGTGRKGVSPLTSRPSVLRPMLAYPKSEIIAYANENGIVWHEDSTNSEDNYLRNYIRHHIMPRLDAATRSKLLALVDRAAATNRQLDTALDGLLLRRADSELDRAMFNQLPHAVAKEVLASWLRASGITQFDAKLLERVTVAAKTQIPGAIIDLMGGARLRIARTSLALELPER